MIYAKWLILFLASLIVDALGLVMVAVAGLFVVLV